MIVILYFFSSNLEYIYDKIIYFKKKKQIMESIFYPSKFILKEISIGHIMQSDYI